MHRHVWQDGLREGVLTAHSILLCFMVGPLGMLSHIITKVAARQWRKQHDTPKLE